MITWLLAVQLAGAADAAARIEPATESWAVERLDLDVTVDPTARRLLVEGRMVVRLEDPRSAGPSLALNARTPAMRFRKATARGVAANVFLRAPAGPVEIAHFELPRQFAQGDLLTVEFALESVAESPQLQMDGGSFFASWVEHWYPLPATAGRGTVSPAAPGTTTFRMPVGWRSVSNGVLTGRSIEGGAVVVERWHSEMPVARSFVAAPFQAEKSVESAGRRIAFHLLRPRDSAEGQARSLSRALRVMEEKWGPYPYPSYHVAEVPEEASFAAGSEQGFIMVRSTVLDDVGASLPLFAHEAAHGWWGNLVRGEGPGAKMLTEALAQYGAVLAIESIEGPAARDEFLRFSRPGYNPLQCALGYFHIWREAGDRPLSRLADARWDHNLADSKGMWFYHMLRARMGDEPFFGVLRSMLHDFAGRQVTLDQFRRLLVSRDPTLAAFLAQWLDRTGAPVLRVEWWSIERGKGLEVEVEQLQDGDPFDFPLELEVAMAAGEARRHTFAVSGRKQRFTAAVPSRALDVRVDPAHRVMMWRPEFGPRPPIAGRSAVPPEGQQ